MKTIVTLRLRAAVLCTLGLTGTAAWPCHDARADNFVKGFLTNAARLFNPDFCFNETLFAAKSPDQCAANEQKIGFGELASRCYDKCRAGYSEAALICTASSCPSGYHMEAAECVFDGQRTLPRSRTSCPAGYTDYGATCTRPPVTRGKGCCEASIPADPKIQSTCAPGQTADGLLCYEPCRDGYYYASGSCWLRCPAGYTDIGELCSWSGPHIYTREMEGCPADYVTEELTCRLDYIVKGKGGCFSGGCEPGYNDQWCTCARNAHVFGRTYKGCPANYDAFAASCIIRTGTIWKDRYLATPHGKSCAPGETQIGALCYSTASGQKSVCGADLCQPGERAESCTCVRDAQTLDRPSTPCPDGYYASSPDFCEKSGSRMRRDTYPLESRPARCPAGRTERLGLCYEPCLSQLDLPVATRVKRALIEAGIPERIEGPGDVAKMILQRFVSGHGWVAFKGMGYTLANVIDPKVGGMFGYDKVRIEQPLLIMYKSERATSDAQLTDMQPDYPYTLVAVGWMKDYKGRALSNEVAPEPAPTDLDAYLPPGKFPQGSWFRHPAGCHMANGSFVAFRENEPAPASNPLEDMANMLKGSAWCGGIGGGSTWKPDAAGVLKAGAPGKCMLTRNFPAQTGMPRPIVPGSFVRKDAPTPSGWPATGYNAAVWQQRLVAEATKACQTVGMDMHPPNLGTLWHPSLWVTHLFLNDENGRVGIMDTSLVPYGYEGPPESFVPMSRKLIPVPRKPAPGATPRPGAPGGGSSQPGGVPGWGPAWNPDLGG